MRPALTSRVVHDVIRHKLTDFAEGAALLGLPRLGIIHTATSSLTSRKVRLLDETTPAWEKIRHKLTDFAEGAALPLAVGALVLYAIRHKLTDFAEGAARSGGDTVPRT